jgi:N utilization substance protein B
VSDKALAGFPARRRARKRAVDVLYEAEQRDRPILDVLDARRRLAMSDPEMPGIPEYTMTLVEGVAEHLDAIDDAIERCLVNWRFDRIPAVDRNILRVATFELRHGDEQLDSAVPISEAVKIAEVLCSDDSPTFVNAVLQNVSML